MICWHVGDTKRAGDDPRDSNDGVTGELEGAVDDDFFAERGGDDVEGTTERREDGGVDLRPEGLEPEAIADQRDAAAEDDPPGGDQGDGLAERERQGAG